MTGRAVTVHDSLFTDSDLDDVLERSVERAQGCPGCGQPRDEVWPDGPEDARRMDSEWASKPMKCVACAKRDTAKRQYESQGSVDRDGIHFPLFRSDAEQG